MHVPGAEGPLMPSDELIFDLTETQLRMANVIQRIVYRCIRMAIGDGGERDPKRFPAIIDLLNTWLQRFVDTGEIHKSQIVFDETIWPPSQPERHGAVVQVFVSVTSQLEYIILEIDLTKGYFDCASLIVPGTRTTPINPFHVVFREATT